MRPYVLAALVFLAASVWQEPVRRWTLTAIRLPFMALKGALRALVTLPRLPALEREHAALRRQLLQQQLELAQLREGVRRVGREAELRGLYPGEQGVVADIIARSPNPTQHVIVLDRGADDGVTLQSIILDASGVVGRVVELHGRTAVVQLLTDPDCRIAALVERSRETGLLAGQGTGSCRLIYMNSDSDVQEGDRVVTAGLGGPFPKGLPLGVVGRVTRDQHLGTAWAVVRPTAQLPRIEEVLCLPAHATP